jgi:predicted short-subunit dehydrogenase-like oxidoreductase (DUF2520 family)
MRTAPDRGRNVERILVNTFRVIGPGRAGLSLMAALDATGEFESTDALGRGVPLADAATGVDLLVIATPDDQVLAVAEAVTPVATTVVVHLSGSLGLDALGSHPRRGSVHPLVPLPTAAIGAARLVSGVTFAVAGDPMAAAVAASLGGRVVAVEDRQRVTYHAAASIAANHAVALIGQVERVAASIGLPLDTFAHLIRAAVDDALELGPRQALTGPASRGDWDTVDRHRRALSALSGPRTELAAYDAMVGLARRLSIEVDPAGVGVGPEAPPTEGPAADRTVAERVA